MFVDPPHWRKGIGRQLLAAIERELMSGQAKGLRVVAGESAVTFCQARRHHLGPSCRSC
jgi:GNAT superfamily N-acetyltransferase